MKYKRLITMCCSMILMGSLFPQTLQASEIALAPDTTLSSSQESRMTYINSASASLSINNNTATVSSTVFGYSNLATKCTIKVTLQEKSFFTWNDVDTKTQTGNDFMLFYSGTYPVVAGKTYRVVSEVTVWCGNNSETRTVTSASQKA